MVTNNEQVYILHGWCIYLCEKAPSDVPILPPVDTFELTAPAGRLIDDDTGDIHIEIRQDGTAVKATEGVKRSKRTPWNKEFLMYV